MAAAVPLQDPLQHLPAVDIDVSEPSIEAYRSVIDWMCERYRNRAGDDLYRGVPINSADPGWFLINLLHPGMPAVSLLIDETNGYLTAFRRGDGTWMRFKDHALPNETEGISLGFDSSYTKLLKDFKKDTTVFGAPTLTDAYHVFVAYAGDLKRCKKALVQVIIMFCEATRFKLLFQRMLEIMEYGTGTTLPISPVMWSWTNNWKVLSAYALNCKYRDLDGNMEDDPELLASVVEFEVNNREDVVQLLGLIMRKRSA